LSLDFIFMVADLVLRVFPITTCISVAILVYVGTSDDSLGTSGLCWQSVSGDFEKRKMANVFFKLHYKNLLYPAGWIPHSNKSC